MRPILRLLILFLAVLPPAVVAEQRLLNVDDFLRIKLVGDPQLSPDGRWVAYTVRTLDLHKDGADTDIYMAPLGDGEPIRLTAGEKSSESPRWSPDGRYLAFVSSREGKHDQIRSEERRVGKECRCR